MNVDQIPLSVLFAILGVLVLMSAYFSGSETALMAVNRYRLRHQVNEGHRGARKAADLLDRPDRMLGLILVGNNLVNFSAATVATIIGMRVAGNTGVLLAPWILTVVFLILAEIGPKTLAAARPEPIAYASAHVLTALMRVLYPVVVAVNWFSNLLVYPFTRGVPEADQLSAEELRTVVNEGAALPGQHQNMMLSILDLDAVTVNDIMVPRADIVGIDIDADMSEIMNLLATSQHTRLPVYRENINDILGILHLRRLTRHLDEEDLSKEDILALVREPYFVPEGTPLHTQLVNFQKNKRRMALVVDEYGDVQGIVALDDILEEIVGEFTTDFAANVPEIHPQEDGSYLIDGLAWLREVNRALSWDLPVTGPRTLNGLILEQLEMIPESNVCCRIGPYRVETLQISGNVIKTARLWDSRTESGEAAASVEEAGL
ncbi:MAG: HlyC/CorC family transporter [Pseudomonadales bacterium]|nr:HlyC/CorC family transporter [Pseudomonadales bacterium]MCP5182774.1 HlyC/CorC family transporter [Pseudomonadales bacterium]